MLNRETGVKPVLSRSCNVELVLLRHWETGKTRLAMKQSQKNCLIIAHYDPAKDRNGALQELFTLFCLYAQKSVFYFAFIFLARETRSARSEKLKI